MNIKLRQKILLLFIFLLISICLWSLTLLRLDVFKSRDVLKVSPQPLQNIFVKTTVSSVDHYVSKSLDEILRSSPELSDHVLFFNHVPKSGGEMLVLLLQWLQGSNGFRHIRLPGGKKRKLTRKEQEELVEEVTRHVRDEAVPVTFDRHVYFLNFTDFSRQSPTFINLVRDPIHKAISRFYYGRVTPNPRNPDMVHAPAAYIKQKNRLLQYKTFEECILKKDSECNFISGLSYDLTIPYFCGHLDLCMVLNDRWALQRAKQNVERYFPVVGILEELNSTLTVLENKLPYFFKGVKKLYYEDLLEPHKNRNRKKPEDISDTVKKHLQTSLTTEYEFYIWLRNRLLRQYETLTSSTSSSSSSLMKYRMPKQYKEHLT